MNDNTNLAEAVIDKALQKPSMFIGVPVVKVFLPEVFILLLVFAFFGFWTVVLLPIHIALVIKTDKNIFWVDDMFTNIFEVKLSGDSGIRGKGVVTHHPYYIMVKRKRGLV